MMKRYNIILGILAILFPTVSVAQSTGNIPEGWIVFTSNRNGNDDIFLMDTAEGSLTRLTTDPATDHRPAISADGSMVIFVSERSGQPDVYLIHLDEYGKSTGSVEQLTNDPWEEFDTDWCGEGHSYQFTVYRSPDTEAMDLFYGSDMPDIEGEWDIYRYNSRMDSIDRLSLEPGDYRYPIYTADYGTVYARRRWENPENQFNILGYFHGALANRSFNFDHGIINGPIRHFSESVLFIPCTDGVDDCYIFYDIMYERILDSLYAGENPLINVTPLPYSEGSQWFLAQTAPEGDCASEVILLQDLGSSNPLVINLTQNDSYDGEPRWITRSGSSSGLEPYALTPGDTPPIPDPVELLIEEIKPIPGSAMVPGMQVISSGENIPLMIEPSAESEQCGELAASESRRIMNVSTDDYGEIWYMIMEIENRYSPVWCRGNMLVPDLRHITEVPFLVWLSSGFAANGQMSMAHELLENINGIGIASEEEDDVLILVYNTANSPTRDWEELFEYQDSKCLFAGQSGYSFESIENLAGMHEFSPSGRYFAIGEDGTGIWRGLVSLIDLESCVKYRYYIPHSGLNFCSHWIDGDFLLMESIVQNTSLSDGIEELPWINQNYFTEARDWLKNIILMHGKRAWIVLPGDRYYNYRLTNNYGVDEQGIFFDVEATPNVIPSLAGIESDSDFTEWIDSMGGSWEAFPRFDFRIHVDTLNMSVTCRSL